jgi:hypothetical protein
LDAKSAELIEVADQMNDERTQVMKMGILFSKQAEEISSRLLVHTQDLHLHTMMHKYEAARSKCDTRVSEIGTLSNQVYSTMQQDTTLRYQLVEFQNGHALQCDYPTKQPEPILNGVKMIGFRLCLSRVSLSSPLGRSGKE